MSKRGEQKALEAYPVRGEWVGNQYGYLDGDINSKARENFREGYEQAEKDLAEEQYNLLNKACDARYELAKKDLALTIEDLELIHTFLYAVKNNKHGAFTFTRLSNEQYQEVLNRFNKSKEKK